MNHTNIPEETWRKRREQKRTLDNRKKQHLETFFRRWSEAGATAAVAAYGRLNAAEKTVIPGDLSPTPLWISPPLPTLSSVSSASGRGGSRQPIYSGRRATDAPRLSRCVHMGCGGKGHFSKVQHQWSEFQVNRGARIWRNPWRRGVAAMERARNLTGQMLLRSIHLSIHPSIHPLSQVLLHSAVVEPIPSL